MSLEHLDAEAWACFRRNYPNAFSYLRFLAYLAEGSYLEGLPLRSEQEDRRLRAIHDAIAEMPLTIA